MVPGNILREWGGACERPENMPLFELTHPEFPQAAAAVCYGCPVVEICHNNQIGLMRALGEQGVRTTVIAGDVADMTNWRLSPVRRQEKQLPQPVTTPSVPREGATEAAGMWIGEAALPAVATVGRPPESARRTPAKRLPADVEARRRVVDWLWSEAGAGLIPKPTIRDWVDQHERSLRRLTTQGDFTQILRVVGGLQRLFGEQIPHELRWEVAMRVPSIEVAVERCEKAVELAPQITRQHPYIPHEDALHLVATRSDNSRVAYLSWLTTRMATVRRTVPAASETLAYNYAKHPGGTFVTQVLRALGNQQAR